RRRAPGQAPGHAVVAADGHLARSTRRSVVAGGVGGRLVTATARRQQQRQRRGGEQPARGRGTERGQRAGGPGRRATAPRAPRAAGARAGRGRGPAGTRPPMDSDFTWIDRPDALLARFEARPARIGLDTEFIRERTWWPHL